MKEFDVLVIGELNVDIILDRIDGFPEIGKEILSEKLTVTLGSSSAIFASNLSTLGARVAFLGKIGKDSHADLVKSTLKTKNVNIDNIIETSEHNTGVTVVLNYDTDRANVTYPGAMNHLTLDDINDDVLKKAKHLHVSSVFMQPGLKTGVVELFKRAESLGLTTSLDPQWDPSEKWDLNIKELLPLIDVFLPNIKEFQFITKTSSVNQGLEKVKDFANVIVIKDGDNGAHLWKENKLFTQKAYLNNKVADCIGAGDSFDAGFISQYIKGIPLEDCLEYGNISGAVNTTKRGGTTAFSSLENFKEIANQKFSIKL